jgi:hypothetical protein
LSPDGNLIVSVSFDGTAALLNAKTGAQLSLFRALTGKIRSAVLSPDGLNLLTASDDGTVRLWALSELGRQTGSSLRDWLCSEEHRKGSRESYTFSQEERQADPRLGGRPSDVCDWRGLNTTYGWRQLWERWRFVLTGADYFADDDKIIKAEGAK